MIVKNESHIIEKTLENIMSYIPLSYWVISDTGSTDNTKEIIENFFGKRNIKGEFIDEPWRDFSYNRNVALRHAYKKSDYLLIFDADDSFHGNLKLPPLTKDMVHLYFGNATIRYKRPLILNNQKKWKWRGVLHEFIVAEEGINGQLIVDGDYFIDSGRTGSRNKDPNKYLNDAKLLERGYEEEKSNDLGLASRYCYYIAQSYRDCPDTKEYQDLAIEWYKKRIEMGGWQQEVYISYIGLGNMHAKQNNFKDAVKAFSDSVKVDPERMEGVIKLVEIFTFNQMYSIVNALYYKFKNYKKSGDKLFSDPQAYENTLEYYNAIAALNCGDSKSGYECCKKVIMEFPRIGRNVFRLKCTISNILLYEKELKNDPNRNDFFCALNKTYYNLYQQNRYENFEPKMVELWEILCEKVQVERLKYRRLKVKKRPVKKIMLTFTTCRRLDLFQKTIHSILHNWLDVLKIDYWFCVDDNSSQDDRTIMKHKYDWIDYYWKKPTEKGHQVSMNIIWKRLKDVSPKYWIHLEDDFLFFEPMNYIEKSIEALERLSNFNVKQILFNKDYGETIDHYQLGGSKPVSNGILLHEYVPDKTFGYNNCHYWPHYSFRPSLTDASTILSLGDFSTDVQFFEMEYAKKYTEAGYRSAFFDRITNKHIGRLTKDRGNNNEKNAYMLNNENQFSKTDCFVSTLWKTYVINLPNRKDRKAYIDKTLSMRFEVFDGVYGKYIQHYHKFRKFLFPLVGEKVILGEIGIKLSFLSLWYKIMDDYKSGKIKCDYFLVLEDDLICNKMFNERIRKFHDKIDEIKPKFDMLYVGGQWTESYGVDTPCYFKEQFIAKDSPNFTDKNNGFYKRNVDEISDYGKLFYSPIFRACGAIFYSISGISKCIAEATTNPKEFLEQAIDMWFLEIQRKKIVDSFDYLPHLFHQGGFDMVVEKELLQTDIHRTETTKLVLPPFDFVQTEHIAFFLRHLDKIQSRNVLLVNDSLGEVVCLINDLVGNSGNVDFVLPDVHPNYLKIQTNIDLLSENRIKMKNNFNFDSVYDTMIILDSIENQTTLKEILSRLKPIFGNIFLYKTAKNTNVIREFTSDNKYDINMEESKEFIRVTSMNIDRIEDEFVFEKGLDIIGNDIGFEKTESIKSLLLKVFEKNSCVAVNTLGFYKSKVCRLEESAYFSGKDGIYILKDKYKKLTRIKMLGHFWENSEKVHEEFSKLTNNCDFSFTTKDPDFYIIINKPNEGDTYDASKTLVFTMEPLAETSDHGTHSWGEWNNPDPKKFLYVHGRDQLNLVQWKMTTPLSEIPQIYSKQLLIESVKEGEKHGESRRVLEKQNHIATILSWKNYFIGHQHRNKFARLLDEENLLHCYGQDNFHKLKHFQGGVPKEDTAQVIAKYQYYFMIENNEENNYATEKIWEPILCETLCFYWGCPNLEDYIHEKAFVRLDMNDYEKSLQIIKTAIDENWWKQRLPFIREAKEKIIHEYSFGVTISNILKNSSFISKTESQVDVKD
jgi:GR25 family glycosyltransferase involved in LPS biosynthesis/tetratricopeptide (TPR) repeat protein